MNRTLYKWSTATIVLLVGFVFTVWYMSSTPTVREAGKSFSQGPSFVSPDGQWAIINQEEPILYDITRNRKVKQFSSEYQVPFLGRQVWSQDSERFLLFAHDQNRETNRYEIWSPQNVLLAKLEFVGEWQGLKAVISSDGRMVVAELQTGVMVWDTKTNNHAVVKMLKMEDSADLQSFTWLNSKEILLCMGYSKPRLALLSVDDMKPVDLQMELMFPIRLPPSAHSRDEVLFLTGNPPKDIRMLNVSSKSISETLVDLSDRDVATGTLSERPRSTASWQWLVSRSGLNVLWRNLGNEKLELVLLERQGKSPNFVEVSTSQLPSVDDNGRVWIWDGETVKQVGAFR